jgi:ABC-2 type transport system ATP-binding protein
MTGSAMTGSAATGTAIEVRDLTMNYGSVSVLRGVSFSVAVGEVFCLLGPNGAGKTTTLEILEGFRRPAGGSVRVLGLDPVAHACRVRERTGIVLQECGFPRQAKVAELIELWRGYFPRSRPLAELLAVVELEPVAGRQVRHLSGGQRRRLDFALALAGDPDLIFLDEPTTGFDPEARRRLWAAVENLHVLGKTVVLTTHYLDEAERLADRIAILRDGVVSLTGTSGEVAVRSGLGTRVSFRTPALVRSGTVPPPAGMGLTVNGTEAVCHTANAAATMRTLLAWAAEHALGDLEGLTVSAPSLEDAYMRLTSDLAGEGDAA